MTEPKEGAAASPSAAAAAIGTTKRILLVEDDRFQRTAVEAALRQQGFDVRIAVDGEEALRLLSEAERPDLVLLDLIMPKVSGFEVLRRLKQDPATSGIPVLVLSNLGQKGDVEQATQAGAAAYLVKAKVTLRELVDRVKATLHQGSG
jgi:two-component system alkaline phosphatase synthesis response regulator PhoP